MVRVHKYSLNQNFIENEMNGQIVIANLKSLLGDWKPNEEKKI